MVIEVKVTPDPLRVPELAFTPDAGAVVDFFGVVRGLEKEQPISGLEYEAFVKMAEKELQTVAEEIGSRFGLQLVILHHRIGFVARAEPSLFLRVAAGHRQAAYDASRQIVELLKLRVPIWKHPRFIAAISGTGH